MDDLNDYIKKVKQNGVSNEEIMKSLKSAGWSPGQIAEAFKYNGIDVHAPLAPKQKKGMPGWAIALIILAIALPLLIFIGSVGLAMFAYSGMLDFSNYTPERCDFGNQLHCIGTASATETGITLALRNALDTDIIIKDITFKEGSDCTPQAISIAIGTSTQEFKDISDDVVPRGEIIKIKTDCSLKPGKSESTMNLRYERTDSGTGFNVEGILLSRIS